MRVSRLDLKLYHFRIFVAVPMTRTALKERQIIGILKDTFDTSPRLPLGFDDDIAVVPFLDRKLVALKSDMLVGSTDVPPRMTLRQAARKAVVATVSDFAAKGIRPIALLISLGLVSPVTASTVRQLAKGLDDGAREYGCRIIGGDTGQANDLIIDCIGFGLAETGTLVRRDSAKPGDVVATTGDFGRTSAGLRILLGQKKNQFRTYSGLVRSILHPLAKLQTGLELARTGAVTASIDSSDGLAWSLHQIANLSRVDIIVEQVPVARDVRLFADEEGLDAENLALFGGEEYELVVTIEKEKFARVKARHPSLQRIGRVQRGVGRISVMIDDRLVRVDPRGYEHFE